MAIRTLFYQTRKLNSYLLFLRHSPTLRTHPIITIRLSSSIFSCHPSSLSPPLFLQFLKLSSQSYASNSTSSSNDINDICRLLSDFRCPHHDLESALVCFSDKISTNLVDQVLKRCKNLGISAHRFFIWARKLPGFSHSKETHHILVDILGSGKQFPLIWDLLSELRDSGNHEISPEMFWIIFRAYCKADLPNDAIRAFKKMEDFGLKPGINDLDQLLYLLCKKKLVQYGQEFFDSVKFEFPPNAKTYSILMRGWCNVGDSVHARNLFEEMSQRGCSVDVVAYNALLESLCKGGSGDEAYQLFREMGSHGLKPNACTYSIFIRASCEANDVHSAIRVLDRMRMYSLVPNVFTYNCILKLLCKNQRVEDAYQILDEMIERGVGPDIWSYNVIQAFHCDHCEVNKALRLINRMEKDGCDPDRHTYNMVLKMLIRVGRFDRTMALWESMVERGFYASVSTYAVMIHGLCKKKGRVEDACKYFEMMVDEGIPPYPCTCQMLKTHLLQLGFWEKIEILGDKMLQSSSCSIQELSKIMIEDGAYIRRKQRKELRKRKDRMM